MRAGKIDINLEHGTFLFLFVGKSLAELSNLLLQLLNLAIKDGMIRRTKKLDVLYKSYFPLRHKTF